MSFHSEYIILCFRECVCFELKLTQSARRKVCDSATLYFVHLNNQRHQYPLQQTIIIFVSIRKRKNDPSVSDDAHRVQHCQITHNATVCYKMLCAECDERVQFMESLIRYSIQKYQEYTLESISEQEENKKCISVKSFGASKDLLIHCAGKSKFKCITPLT